MATREENMKKLNEELEKMSDEQLEEVAGGKKHRIIDFKLVDDFTPKIQNDEPNLKIPGGPRTLLK